MENRTSLIILGEAASKAPPDGHTLLLTAGSLWLAPLVQDNVPYNVVRDFSPITAVARSPSFLVVHPSLPVKSVKELIALAKARPGALNYASGVIGGADHLAAELFKAMARVNMTHVPYSSAALMMADLVGGHVHLSFPPGATAAQYIRSGKLRALGTTGAGRSTVFPDLPTVAATVPGYEAVQLLGLWAPAKTPAAIVNRLNQEVVRALNSSATKEKLFNVGVEIIGSSPERFAAIISSEIAKWSKLIKDVGIHVK
ncbi:MAG: tripartite tricarboxylate transporter substrate binding protein [Betaproteobacteria bacterium]|nr:tripartite tricarboxylate transporter substrate binding protein [Betaproteobacteria bacterium]